MQDSEDHNSPFFLYIATPLYDHVGPIDTVHLFNRYMLSAGDTYGFDVLDIEIGPDMRNFIEILRNSFGVGSGGVAHINNSNVQIDGKKYYINEAVIFHADKQYSPEKLHRLQKKFTEHVELLEAA